MGHGKKNVSSQLAHSKNAIVLWEPIRQVSCFDSCILEAIFFIFYVNK